MSINGLNFSIIVAMANNRGIGHKNQLLWHLPNDLKRFKAITMGKPIIMGRKTFESIGRVLPGRENIILTKDVNRIKIKDNENLKVFNNIDSLIEYLQSQYKDDEIMVIGGGKIYKLFLEYANKIYLTMVDADIVADTYFPQLDPKRWLELEEETESHKIDEQHKYNYIFKNYQLR